MEPLQICTFLTLIALWTVYTCYKRYTRASISDIAGPNPTSFWLGNTPELTLPEAGVTEAKWQQQFGNVVRIRASMGEDRLWVADPTALRHILQISGYNYPKPTGDTAIFELLADRGIVWAQGDVHKRHRKAMLPAFGVPEIRQLLPLFRNSIENVVTRWKDVIASESSGKHTVIDVTEWLGKAALDAVGEAAFDYSFGSVEGADNSLAKSYTNLVADAFGTPSTGQLFFNNVSDHVPLWILRGLCNYVPARMFKRLRENRAEVQKAAKTLLAAKRLESSKGETKKDVMSLLLKANDSEDERNRLRDDEIIPQMRTMLLAGHETTSNAVAWILYELSENPGIQSRMREEVKKAQLRVQARGGMDFTATDYEDMPYTTAVMKESLRLHPGGVQLNRVVGKDDVIPLHRPITTLSGKVITEIPVAKGTILNISVVGYNTNKDVWGQDALKFNPKRWLSPTEKLSPTLGVYGNLLSFSAGVRSCIGWRFAVLEIHTFLVTLLANFEFALPENGKKIIGYRSMAVVPAVEGETHKGAQLLLKVSSVGPG